MINHRFWKASIAFLTVLVLAVLALTGCGKSAAESGTSGALQSTEAAASTQAEQEQNPAETAEPAQPEPNRAEIPDAETGHTNTIVVYFSATGHTEPLAGYAADYLHADLYEIVPEKAYTDADLNYSDSSSRTSREQNDASARPAIAGTLPDLSGYDTVMIGHPIWWGQAPKIIYTFLESYNWSGKTLVTFCTSASSGLGSSAENLKPSAAGDPTWLESRRFPIGASQNEVADWLQQILPNALQVDKRIESKENSVEKRLVLSIDGQKIPVSWEDNVSVAEIMEYASEKAIHVDMHMYGGWEQVGSLGQSFSKNDTQMATQNGDIVLYSGNQIVLFYGSNSWAYTKLGHITLSAEEVTSLLDQNSVSLTLEMN